MFLLSLNLFALIFNILPCPSSGGANLPDASQEGILKQYTSYDDLALFHYTVPSETTRATWEFASFQDEPDCPSREVLIYLQYASFPVISPDNATFANNFYTIRTDLHYIKTHSAFQPHDSTIFPIYNPLPGSWYAFAYLSPYEEKITQQGLLHKCRYSLGSIALWTKADQVELIIPFQNMEYSTKKHFSYYKFYISDNIDNYKLYISNCTIKHQIKERIFGRKDCIEYVNLRARALPRHDPNVGGFTNITEGDQVVFNETRPYKSSYYYLLIVSSAVVKFNLELKYIDCGKSGLYGPNQRSWYLTEQGLHYNSSRDNTDPKEPKDGFQLFTITNKLTDKDEVVNFDLDIPGPEDLEPRCFSMFDFNRIDLVEDFSANYVLQGKSWYTKWISVSTRFPIITRFETLEYTDIGGTVNIVMRIESPEPEIIQGQSLRVYGCLSKGRIPLISEGTLECDDDERIEISADMSEQNVTKLIPFPEPGTWYLALQAECLDPETGEKIDCWGNLRFGSVMTSVNIHIQPCGYRPQSDICGEYGVCVRSHKGNFLYTSCRCASGYKGWTCDETTQENPGHQHQSNTLLLTLSNLSFLPAILVSLYYRLYTESLLYFSTMFFSTFYHTCDQDINHKHLPEPLERACHALYVSKEVLQFCDFFCAIMSFWVTIISMARLPVKLVNFLHMFGVLLISVLVQYNRNGIQVFAIPIPLGAAILIISTIIRSYKRRRLLRVNRTCTLWLSLAIISALSAVLVFALIETTTNYQYVHSLWHCLIAMSLVFLLPYCRRENAKHSFYKSGSLSSEETEPGSINWGGVRPLHPSTISTRTADTDTDVHVEGVTVRAISIDRLSDVGQSNC
ncbi:post-GPI attachment to proteins factor 6 [Eurytemora carolleeae]|uniref:post-GPI attachment to proteins factor 6 n=1 Tax=Eurytemora carolleeae TaxID=1294199 RepID=UPI000C794184|nr:post-GPI attachment to proteins factor 6 [Eurytemora carolleeae]|eukprot:XP_023328883.1 post-GPI attachment to proteins factor 6-like [Eurytemora affinis]